MFQGLGASGPEGLEPKYYPHVTSALLGPNIFLGSLFSKLST